MPSLPQNLGKQVIKRIVFYCIAVTVEHRARAPVWARSCMMRDKNSLTFLCFHNLCSAGNPLNRLSGKGSPKYMDPSYQSPA